VFCRDISQRKKAEQSMRNLAYYDTLTNLPNRRMLSDRLAQAMAVSKRSGRFGALLFLDLDNFKPLNDNHGHEIGDELLIEAARRIKLCVREVDTVARYGGDEFVVLLTELDEDRSTSVEQATAVAEKIRQSLGEVYHISIKLSDEQQQNIEHLCTVSIGVAFFLNHEVSEQDLLKWADKSMYQAKLNGRNQIQFFNEPTKNRES
jgi:diguanylate cyclase (GGDEF)-like protein